MDDETRTLSKPVPVPEGWTVEQAEAVLDFLYALESAVFSAYERPLVARALREGNGPHPVDVDHATDLEADGDPIPF